MLLMINTHTYTQRHTDKQLQIPPIESCLPIANQQKKQQLQKIYMRKQKIKIKTNKIKRRRTNAARM